MNRRFECWNCGKAFNADDSNYVKCPHCHSDNVDYATFHLPCWVGRTVLCLLVVMGLVIIAGNMDWTTIFSKGNIAEDVSVDSVIIEETKIDSTFIAETGLDIPMTIVPQEPQYSDEGYSLSVAVKDVSVSGFHFELRDVFDDNIVVAKSNSGKFEEVAPSDAPSGMYKVVAVLNSNDSVLADIEVSGFIHQKKATNKLSVSELQALIDNRDMTLMGIGESEFLASGYTLSFSGLSSGETKMPKILAEVFSKLDDEVWISVTVIDVSYNDKNQITNIKLAIKEEDNDD